MSILTLSNLSHNFGGLRAVVNFNLTLHRCEIVGLIGPNGAGKTTVFNLITGYFNPSHGSIVFSGVDITGMKPYKIARMGIGRTFQSCRLFDQMSVIENVKVSALPRVEYNFLHSLVHSRYFWEEEQRLEDYCYCLLEIFGLHTRAKEPAGSLPFGLQKRLEIARALATQPKVLLLDEPAGGMNPHETKELIETISWVCEEFDVTVLLIEHNMRLVMNICRRIVVMDFGETIAEGTPAQIQSNSKVVEAYLGKGDNNAASS